MQIIHGRGKSSNSITQSLDNNNDDIVDDDNDNDDACDYSQALSPFVFSARKTGAKRMNEAQRDYGGPMDFEQNWCKKGEGSNREHCGRKDFKMAQKLGGQNLGALWEKELKMTRPSEC